VTTSLEARRARVCAVVAAGRRAADPADPLGREARAALLASSGLSREGVELALTVHLETHPAPEHLQVLLAATRVAPRCHVVLSANVCIAALRAIAVAAAVAPVVSVRPSRRDPGLALPLARALAEDPAFAAAGAAVTCVDAIATAPGDELHLYGGDDAVRAIAAGMAPGVIVRAHGTGLGVAVVGPDCAVEVAARAVARDVIPFDQRGCLSPRVALIEGSARRAAAFACALDWALRSLSARVPRGPLDDGARTELARYRASIQAIGEIWEGPDHAVGLDPCPRALLLPPAARVVHVVPAVAAAAPVLVGPWARYLTSIGSSRKGSLAPAVQALAPGARRAPLGEMQRPPLDGPVDLRPC
jgi:Acyl-CoA reductase (LuxC)